MVATALSRASARGSISVTFSSEFNSAIAMPVPIKPPPITATEWITPAADVFGPGMRATSRRPKNTWRSPSDASESIKLSNSRFSSASPSAKGRVQAASTQSMMKAGA